MNSRRWAQRVRNGYVGNNIGRRSKCSNSEDMRKGGGVDKVKEQTDMLAENFPIRKFQLFITEMIFFFLFLLLLLIS